MSLIDSYEWSIAVWSAAVGRRITHKSPNQHCRAAVSRKSKRALETGLELQEQARCPWLLRKARLPVEVHHGDDYTNTPAFIFFSSLTNYMHSLFFSHANYYMHTMLTAIFNSLPGWTICSGRRRLLHAQSWPRASKPARPFLCSKSNPTQE